MYSLMENSQDMDQFLKSIYRYIQIGVYIRGYQDKETKRFVREIAEVCEFYVNEDNDAKYNILYRKTPDGHIIKHKPTKYLLDYLEAQGVLIPDGLIKDEEINTGKSILDVDSTDTPGGMKIEDFTNGASDDEIKEATEASGQVATPNVNEVPAQAGTVNATGVVNSQPTVQNVQQTQAVQQNSTTPMPNQN